MWFDSHCHLYELDHPNSDTETLDEVLQRAGDAGVTDILVPGTDLESSEHAVRLAARPGVWAAAAYHPSSAKGWEDSWAEPIDELLALDSVRAVGETGLDHYWDTSFNDDQERAFLAHVAMSKKYDKALVIHTRDSLDVVIEILERVDAPPRTIFHCWSGETHEQMRRVLSLGAYVSFAGNVSFKNAPGLRTAAGLVPEDRLLVETDSPYLAPVPKRGKKNEPSFLVHVGEAVASARHSEPEEIAAITTRNARTIFGLSS